MKNTLAHDLDAISRINAIPNILEVVCRTTGPAFAAVRADASGEVSP